MYQTIEIQSVQIVAVVVVVFIVVVVVVVYSFSWDTQLTRKSPIALRLILRGSPGPTA